MASCKDCVHFEVCSEKNLHVAVGMNIIPRFKYKRIEQECDHFKDRSIFIKLPDINCSVNEQFSEYVKGLFDIAKASGNPLNILQALSECFAQSAEQAEQALKERENSV